MNFINEVVRSTFDARDYTINADTNLPTEYSCPAKVPVKNQGTKPTCVAHAAASLVEYHHKRQNDNNYRAFSTEFIYGTRDIGYYVGDGMMIHSPQTGDVVKYTSIVSGNYNNVYYTARRIAKDC